MNTMGFLRALAPILVWNTPLLACPELPTPAERRHEDKVWQYVWDLTEAASWLRSESAPLPMPLLDYRDFANSQTDTDPFILLARQRAVFEKAFGAQDASIQAFHLIENREVGSIGRSTCVETLLMTEHLKYHPLNVPGSEFSAQLFRKGSQLKVFAAFMEEASMAAPAIRIDPSVRQRLRADGWEFISFVHNHPFSFDNPYGDISGTVIPSEPDLKTFRTLFQTEGLQRAWITNGLHTARYSSEDTGRLLEAEGD